MSAAAEPGPGGGGRGSGWLVVGRGQMGFGAWRRVRVVVDGVRVAALRPGEQQAVVVEAGRRSVVARLGSRRSAPLVVDVRAASLGGASAAGGGEVSVEVRVTVPEVAGRLVGRTWWVGPVPPLRVGVVERFARW